jgi:hypothetical protein
VLHPANAVIGSETNAKKGNVDRTRFSMSVSHSR